MKTSVVWTLGNWLNQRSITCWPSMYNRMPSSELVVKRYVPELGNVTERVKRAENCVAGTLHWVLGLAPFQVKLSAEVPSSRTITGLPDRPMVLKYSPLQWSAGTVALHPPDDNNCQ